MKEKTINYLELKILSKINFTDVRILDLRENKPTSKEYTSSIQKLEINSINSKNILEFIANYDNGFFLPEKCDAYEPIREKFDINNLNAPIRWLSQPGCAVYLKKVKPFKYEGVIENHCIAMVWDEKGIALSINEGLYKERDPNYLCEIWFHIEEKICKFKSIDYLLDFFNKLFENINGEYGFIKTSDGKFIIEKGELIR